MDVIHEIATSDEYVHRITERASTDPARGATRSDEEFLAALYQELLGREPDAYGQASFLTSLREGAPRSLVAGTLAGSDEHLNRVGREFHTLTDLGTLRPERFGTERELGSDDERRVFVATGPSDFDWLETAILEHGYYEKPGVWSYGIDLDKQVMAELLSTFDPSLALDVGCASGAVIHCLRDRGVAAEGVEISELAIERAEPDIRPLIHRGDLLALDLSDRYDLVFGLDIFEHLNPNRIDAYLRALTRSLVPGGFVFANIPVFGEDPVWGTAARIDLESWRRDADAGRHFHALPVDDEGYPVLGHLVWADSDWWVRHFASAGLRREAEIERALHRRYDEFFLATYPGRYAFYVLSRDASARAVQSVVERVEDLGPLP